jgi:predicted transcriptional regulator
MPTTTIRLEAELKARIVAAAARAGTTPHAFILDTLARGIERAEREAAFQHVADTRWAEVVATGRTVAWEDARAWLQARARGEQVRRPATGEQRVPRPAARDAGD